MAYLDTNVIVSYCFKDENYAKATKIIEDLRRGHKQLYISPLTLTELFTVASTKGNEFKLPPHFKPFDKKTRVKLLVKYALETLNPAIAPDDVITEKLDETSVFHIYKKAIELSPTLELPTLDLLHAVYALHLASKGLVDTLVSLDKKVLARKKRLESLGISVYEPE
ncbi:PIN domain-containing protein [Thermofilum sp.]|jgi:predicted nucleic acid-binding protein|uniref:type II toxin-antitoxin system VapC family toxin n=1 Tax=Thermofilum sp. TaxID=1961369 RepID=UPI00258F9A57|nr:PIN domain-containing protein [Thermofilum sp.]